jgi:tRNA modification GTPase
VILCLVDAAQPARVVEDGLVIATKIDLAPAPVGIVGVSVVTGEGFAALEAHLALLALELTASGSEPVLTQARHVAALRDAVGSLRNALDCDLPELRAEDLRLSLQALGRITGAVDAEAILDDVFGAFCIGK